MENIIIKSENKKIKKAIIIIIAIIAVALLAAWLYTASAHKKYSELGADYYRVGRELTGTGKNQYGVTTYNYKWVNSTMKDMYEQAVGTAHLFNKLSLISAFLFIVDAAIFVLLLILNGTIFKSRIFVTGEKVYGKTSSGANFDVPVDSIVEITPKGKKKLKICTASNKHTVYTKERDAVKKAIEDLLSKSKTASPADTKISIPDELQKFKNLLDSGAITQEEYNEKKKQILGM